MIRIRLGRRVALVLGSYDPGLRTAGTGGSVPGCWYTADRAEGQVYGLLWFPAVLDAAIALEVHVDEEAVGVMRTKRKQS